jgi:hypothetical protein
MKSNKQPAFPVQWELDGKMVADPGMTLRDYFAAKAMASYMSYDIAYENSDACDNGELEGDYYNGIAKSSYKMADAMLKAREQ